MKAPDLGPLIERLRRRKIVQWTLAYLSVAWLLLQVVDVVGEPFSWPVALVRGITVALGFGLVATVVLAWYHGEKGRQRITRSEVLLLGAILFVGAGVLVRMVGGGEGSAAPEAATPPAPLGGAEISPDPRTVAIFPFASSVSDPDLRRLGRDLAVTLAATLDGIDTLRTVDGLTIRAQISSDSVPLELPEAAAAAERVGAGRLLRGTLSRQGDRLRVDAALYSSGDDRPTARVSGVEAPAELGALTDSVALAVVRRLWSGSTPELPSPAALATSSAEALRAYVDGEEALAAGEMAAAVTAFERAVEADSTYWIAYWRSLYPRVYEGSRLDPALLARVVDHRADLPPADRILVEASLTSTVRERLRTLEEAIRRFPTHWPSWRTYGDLLVHWSPYLGTTYEEARAAFERVLALNPDFGTAWEHLFWIAAHQRDTAATARALAEMERFDRPGGFKFNEDLLTYYRTATGLVSGGDRLSPDALDAVAGYIAGYTGPLPPDAFGVGLLIMGLPRGQVQIADRVLEMDPGADLAAAMWRGKAYGWAGRGAWDSVAVATERWARMEGTPEAALRGYGLLATGAALGIVGPEEAAPRRPSGLPSDARPRDRAELAWLDGIAAYAAGDVDALDRARRRLAASGGPFVPLQTASLDALRSHASGRPREAIETLTAAEDSAANHYLHGQYDTSHPYLSTVDRVLLGRWLREAGRHAEAVRLLSWMEAVIPGAPPLEVVNRTAGRLGLYERARAEEAMDRDGDARVHYRRFLDSVDRPVPALAPLIEEARAGLRRLDGATR